MGLFTRILAVIFREFKVGASIIVYRSSFQKKTSGLDDMYVDEKVFQSQ